MPRCPSMSCPRSIRSSTNFLVKLLLLCTQCTTHILLAIRTMPPRDLSISSMKSHKMLFPHSFYSPPSMLIVLVIIYRPAPSDAEVQRRTILTSSTTSPRTRTTFQFRVLRRVPGSTSQQGPSPSSKTSTSTATSPSHPNASNDSRTSSKSTL